MQNPNDIGLVKGLVGEAGLSALLDPKNFQGRSLEFVTDEEAALLERVRWLKNAVQQRETEVGQLQGRVDEARDHLASLRSQLDPFLPKSGPPCMVTPAPIEPTPGPNSNP